MRIISKFKDYYDSASAYGIDMECPYVREEKVATFTREQAHKKNMLQFRGDSGLKLAVIGFCGKLYPVAQYKYTEKQESYPFFKEKYLNFYSVEELRENLPDDLVHKISERGGLFYRGESSFFYNNNWPSLEMFFKHSFTQLQDYFINEHCPVFIYTSEDNRYEGLMELRVNSSLKNFGFFKQKDPASAFQEIYMYLAGVLGNQEKETINVSDKVRIQQHGFDKYSFRKLPQEKK